MDHSYLDLPEFRHLYVNSGEGPEPRVRFYVEGIQCSACVWKLEEEVQRHPEIKSFSFDAANSIATVGFSANAELAKFPNSLQPLGLQAHPIKLKDLPTENIKKENKKKLIQIGVAGFCAGNIMMFSGAIYAGAPPQFERFFQAMNFVMMFPLLIFSFGPMFKSAAKALLKKHITIDLSISIILLFGFVLSSYHFLLGKGDVYFDSISVFAFLLLTSRYILSLIQRRVLKQKNYVETLFNLYWVYCWNSEKQHFVKCPVENVEKGDVVRLEKGQTLPFDGVVRSEGVLLNLAILTGESIPQKVIRNNQIYAGSEVLSQEVEIEVTATTENTRMGHLIQKVEDQFREKLNFDGQGERFATYFTGIIFAISLLSYAILFMTVPREALNRILAFVLIACPCAFVFALPLVKGLSLHKGFVQGIIYKNFNVFSKILSVQNIFFDKTGTLTKGILSIHSWDTQNLAREDLAAWFSLEQHSHHPIARALTWYLSEELCLSSVEVEGFAVIPAKGVHGRVGKHVYEIRPAQAPEFNGSEILYKVQFLKDEKVISEAILVDELKPESQGLIQALQSMGKNVFLLSGDLKTNVELTAQQLGLAKTCVFSELTPEEKQTLISQYPNSMMVGDGLNDSAAFAAADVAVAVQGSVVGSFEVSDVMLLQNDLRCLLTLFEDAQSVGKALKRNMYFSVAYNITVGSFALLGFIHPLAAAILMPLSSITLIIMSLMNLKILFLQKKIKVKAA